MDRIWMGKDAATDACSLNPAASGRIYPDQGPALIEPMVEKGTFSFREL